MSPASTQSIRLLSYNIHGCVGRGGREDPDGILEIIRQADADFVALQEVQEKDEADLSFLSGVRRLPYSDVIYGQTMQKPFGAYGNLLLSRHPLSHVERRDISYSKREPRGIIDVSSHVCGMPVHLMTTHLGLRQPERAVQIQQLLDLRSKHTAAAPGSVEIVMGDMNEWFPFSRNIRSLQDSFAWHSKLNTFPAGFPILALDRIFVAGPIDSVHFTRVDSKLARLVSDHLPLMAEIIL